MVAADSSETRMTTAGAPHPSDGALSSGATVDALGGAEFRELLSAGLDWLDAHHDIVNALNVFPVPDGDTGTNMLLTMKSALHEITAANANTVGEVARAAAHGALMGARGNSGVILSQILRGVARSLDDQPTITGQRFAAALSEGSRIAYKGVNRPVEGTILTVVREAAAAAELAAQSNADLRFVMAETVRAADESVANTPKLLPVLAQANKVDSGGKGLFFILEGMYRRAARRDDPGAGLNRRPTRSDCGRAWARPPLERPPRTPQPGSRLRRAIPGGRQEPRRRRHSHADHGDG